MFNPIFITLLIFGGWISYYDIKRGKIKNYSLLALVLVAIFINVFFTGTFLEFPLASFLNILFGIFLAVMIWIAGIWSAADAKLFIAINFLFSVSFYKYNFGLFPGISLLINSSIPLLLFLFSQIMIKTNFEEKKKALFAYLKLSFILQFLLAITAIFCLNFFISHFLKIRTEYLIRLTTLVLLYWFIEQKLKIKLNYFFISVILLTILVSLIFNLPLFGFHSLSLIPSLFFLLFLFYGIVRLGTPLFAQSVKIDKLKEGVIPAEMIVERKGNYMKIPITFLSFLSLLRQKGRWKPLIGFNPDGLDKEEIEEIQSLYGKGLLKFEELKISMTIPFAPILFSGALLTYFFKGPLSF
ncbi:MAG: hypothetical protein CO031_00705 [Candidatus Nealsonbacteria bacterium CG_4_9_14_0_2_um_filter_37_38]|nr:MAG: hypothetical protein CO031_00705 [Candidatus Nealsonbacteria bacterium CG_4_9_14_0_2_um_filter_37_38]